MWGKVLLRIGLSRMMRITPTYVGKRRRSSFLENAGWDHPHVCGEKKLTNPISRIAVGSPPRMWGKDSPSI